MGRYTPKLVVLDKKNEHFMFVECPGICMQEMI